MHSVGGEYGPGVSGGGGAKVGATGGEEKPFAAGHVSVIKDDRTSNLADMFNYFIAIRKFLKTHVVGGEILRTAIVL